MMLILGQLYKHRKKRKSKINEEEVRKILEMEQINIMYTSNTGNVKCKTSWTLFEITDNINRQTQKHQGKDRGTLIAINAALAFVIECYQQRNTIPKPGLMIIWSQNKQSEKLLLTLQYDQPTTYKMKRSKAELENIIRKSLINFKIIESSHRLQKKHANK
jgi:hypothetical protein